MQEPQSRKRKRPAKKDHTYSPEILQTFGSLGDIDCYFHLSPALTVALSCLFQSVQVLLCPETTAEAAIQASRSLIISFVGHFHEITTNPKSEPSSDPTNAIQSIYALLITLYSSTKLSHCQTPIVAELIMDLVTNCVTLIDDICTFVVRATLNKTVYPKDYRRHLCNGILTLCTLTPIDSPFRQALLMCLLLEFQAVRSSRRDGQVEIQARDDCLWYLYCLVEEIIIRTRRLGKLVVLQAQELIRESISSGGEEGLERGGWLVWKICGLLCGSGAVKLEVQSKI